MTVTLMGRDQVVLSVALLALLLSMYTLAGAAGSTLQLRYVVTSSMEPAIPRGSLVVVGGAAGLDYMVGDVVLAEYESIPILHRVVSIDYDDMRVITRGDNRDTIEIISWGEVEGVMLLGVPYIALPLIDREAMALLVAIVTLYVVGVVLRWAAASQ